MLSDLTYAERRQDRYLDEQLVVDRVDMGVVLEVVEVDPTKPMREGEPPPLRTIRTHRRGNMVAIDFVNGRRRAVWCGPTQNPVRWRCSVDQERLVLHGDDLPPWVLIQGSEGSGKTSIIPQWLAFQMFEFIGTDAEAGITAPTNKRMAHIKRAIAAHWPAAWYRYVDDVKLYTWHVGPRFQLVSAHQQSQAEGSPIQGFTWVRATGDELQDHYDKDADIIARLRDPRAGGRAKRLNTSTFKDAPGWRDFRGKAEGNDRWHLEKLLGLRSPFIHPEHWESMRLGMTEREYQRRVLAMDVGPERQLYYSWRRHLEADGKRLPGNLRPLPVGAVDVTARELQRWGRNVGLLIGHDPGKRQHVSVLLKAYEFPERRRDANGRPLPPLVRWFVVDEITTPECTVEAHVSRVLKVVREKWHCNMLDWRGQRSEDAPTALVRIDPHTPSGNEHPDRTVYSQWRNAGFATFAAAYNAQTQKPTPIKVEARVDLLNTLLCNTDNERRLFVLCDDQGTPAAPKLVAAFESMERDESGNAEWERKDESDKSHWPSATAFALWSIEKPRVDAYRSRVA